MAGFYNDGEQMLRPGVYMRIVNGGETSTAPAFQQVIPTPPTDPAPTTYLYNGIELPALPEWDKQTYPYAFIEHEHNGSNSALYISTKPLVCKYVKGYGNTLYPEDDSKLSYKEGYLRRNKELVTDFEFYSEYENRSRIEFVGQDNIIWANHTIMDRDDGHTVVEATDPIPVYE